eukprot:1191326-Prorocentrum_minimum.AAC.2
MAEPRAPGVSIGQLGVAGPISRHELAEVAVASLVIGHQGARRRVQPGQPRAAPSKLFSSL